MSTGRTEDKLMGACGNWKSCAAPRGMERSAKLLIALLFHQSGPVIALRRSHIINRSRGLTVKCRRSQNTGVVYLKGRVCERRNDEKTIIKMPNRPTNVGKKRATSTPIMRATSEKGTSVRRPRKAVAQKFEEETMAVNDGAARRSWACSLSSVSEVRTLAEKTAERHELLVRSTIRSRLRVCIESDWEATPLSISPTVAATKTR